MKDKKKKRGKKKRHRASMNVNDKQKKKKEREIYTRTLLRGERPLKTKKSKRLLKRV